MVQPDLNDLLVYSSFVDSTHEIMTSRVCCHIEML